MVADASAVQGSGEFRRAGIRVTPSLMNARGERADDVLGRDGSRRGRRRLVWAVGVVVGVALIAVVGVGIYVFSLASTFDSGRHVAAPAFPRSRPPASTGQAARAVNILLLGVDENSTEAKRAG